MAVTIEAGLRDVLEWSFATEPPAAVEAKARELVLDTLGCVLAAAPRLRTLGTQFASSDPGGARVPGFDGSFSTGSASALFAIAACWDEACEGLARAHGRPGVPVIAACLALAQVRSTTLNELICAIVTGYEIGGRLGEVLRIAPGMHVDGTWPGLGVAAAAVRLSGGSAEQALTAVRIAACQMPFTLYLPVKTGAEARNTFLAHSAQLGLLAANAALAGFTAPDGALEELRARALAGAPQAGRLAPAGEWLIAEAYLKPFAAVRHVHYGTAAALELRPRMADRLERISRITLSIYAEALTYCAIRAPANAIQAQFSLSYGIARALATGDLGPSAYSRDALDDALVCSLESKVELMDDSALTQAARRGARLTVEIDGERLEHRVDRVIGDPAMPMTREHAVSKFARYAGRTPQDAAWLLDAPGDRTVSALIERFTAAEAPNRP